jgi:hypothetical protein
MQNIEGLWKVELEKLLKDLKTYKDLMKKVWKRGKDIFNNKFNWINQYSVEYYGDIDESFVLAEAKEIYKKMFNIDVNDKDIKLIKNEKIKWWMKVYLNDNLVDLSFLKFYNMLNK